MGIHKCYKFYYSYNLYNPEKINIWHERKSQYNENRITNVISVSKTFQLENNFQIFYNNLSEKAYIIEPSIAICYLFRFENIILYFFLS